MGKLGVTCFVSISLTLSAPGERDPYHRLNAGHANRHQLYGNQLLSPPVKSIQKRAYNCGRRSNMLAVCSVESWSPPGVRIPKSRPVASNGVQILSP
jgi:hypothetical protein